MVKKRCNEFVERIDVECDSAIVLKLSGTLLGTEDRLYLSTYVPPSGSRFHDSADSNGHIVEIERCLCDLLDKFGDMSIICNGDFNARTANYQVEQAFVQNYDSDVTDRVEMWECSRVSQDSQLKKFGKKTFRIIYIV